MWMSSHQEPSIALAPRMSPWKTGEKRVEHLPSARGLMRMSMVNWCGHQVQLICLDSPLLHDCSWTKQRSGLLILAGMTAIWGWPEAFVCFWISGNRAPDCRSNGDPHLGCVWLHREAFIGFPQIVTHKMPEINSQTWQLEYSGMRRTQWPAGMVTSDSWAVATLCLCQNSFGKWPSRNDVSFFVHSKKGVVQSCLLVYQRVCFATS